MKSETEKLTIPTRTEYLENVRQLISKFVKDNIKIDSVALMRIVLALDEAVSNIMEHSHKMNHDLSINLQAFIDDKKLVVLIRDEGDHNFHPDDIEMVDLKNHIEKRKKSGLGWHIIRTIMDEVKYEHLPDQGNLLTLIKYHVMF